MICTQDTFDLTFEKSPLDEYYLWSYFVRDVLLFIRAE